MGVGCKLGIPNNGSPVWLAQIFAIYHTARLCLNEGPLKLQLGDLRVTLHTGHIYMESMQVIYLAARSPKRISQTVEPTNPEDIAAHAMPRVEGCSRKHPPSWEEWFARLCFRVSECRKSPLRDPGKGKYCSIGI